MKVYVGDISYNLNSMIDRSILIRAGIDPEKLRQQQLMKNQFYKNQKIKNQYKCEYF
jgi:hypothetical protein